MNSKKNFFRRNRRKLTIWGVVLVVAIALIVFVRKPYINKYSTISSSIIVQQSFNNLETRFYASNILAALSSEKTYMYPEVDTFTKVSELDDFKGEYRYDDTYYKYFLNGFGEGYALATEVEMYGNAEASDLNELEAILSEEFKNLEVNYRLGIKHIELKDNYPSSYEEKRKYLETMPILEPSEGNKLYYVTIFKATSSTWEGEKVMGVTSKKLFNDNANNSIAAQEKYSGKLLYVEGILDKVEKRGFSEWKHGEQYFLMFEPRLSCILKEESIELAGKLRPGMTIGVVGYFEVKDYSEAIVDCKVVAAE